MKEAEDRRDKNKKKLTYAILGFNNLADAIQHSILIIAKRNSLSSLLRQQNSIGNDQLQTHYFVIHLLQFLITESHSQVHHSGFDCIHLIFQ